MSENDEGRLEGYYWLRCGQDWEIGLWSDKHHYASGWTWQLIGFEEPFYSNELHEVIERRIERVSQ